MPYGRISLLFSFRRTATAFSWPQVGEDSGGARIGRRSVRASSCPGGPRPAFSAAGRPLCSARQNSPLPPSSAALRPRRGAAAPRPRLPVAAKAAMGAADPNEDTMTHDLPDDAEPAHASSATARLLEALQL